MIPLGSSPSRLPWPPGFAPDELARLPWRELPAHWRRVDIVSDLHLSPDTPAIAAALQAHLAQTPADAVWLLGDVFEVWVGDDAAEVEGAFEAQQIAVLAAAAARPGLQIALMRGNRDFLLGDALLQRAGVQPLPDPLRVRAWGQTALLTHGDALCLDDGDYLAFRASVRSPAWQQAFLARPLVERQAFARAARERSAQSQQQAHAAARAAGEGEPGDIHPDAPAALLDASGCQRLIHGHTHRPQDHTLPDGRLCHVLADWREQGGGADADTSRKFSLTQAQVLVWTPDGLHRQDL
ncbi:UDP-2,3-diacylglucosamine diphosphatase [Amphibiibacter pelophylacis]|uniref:UDP-2,3-diacylglucosamine diphosphatase n=1 Tax=Amphibiibacter pelophylacis TaxID=1799477 RepID=A0ACC6NYZ7_9BURK